MRWRPTSAGRISPSRSSASTRSAAASQRIGLSATQKPIETIARFLTGAERRRARLRDRRRGPCARARAAARGPVLAARSGDVGGGLDAGLRPARRASSRSTARPSSSSTRGAWPSGVARQLSDRLGEANVTAHHGSMARELRLDAEQRLKNGRAAAPSSRPPRWSSASISATSISFARSARRARSRASCNGSGAPAMPSAARRRGGCFRCRATNSSNARRCSTASRAANSTSSAMPEQPLDVLAQQIVAEVAAQEWGERRAVRSIQASVAVSRARRGDVSAESCRCSRMVSRRGAAGAARSSITTASIISCAAAAGRASPRITSGGAIPETADYRVLLEPDNLRSAR